MMSYIQICQAGVIQGSLGSRNKSLTDGLDDTSVNVEPPQPCFYMLLIAGVAL